MNEITITRTGLRLLHQPVLSHGVNQLTNATRSGTLKVAGLASEPRGGDQSWGYLLRLFF